MLPSCFQPEKRSMRYVKSDDVARASRLVDFDAYGSISRTGSVRGMQKLYGWKPKGQVRIGSYIYNVGPENVHKLNAANLLR